VPEQQRPSRLDLRGLNVCPMVTDLSLGPDLHQRGPDRHVLDMDGSGRGYVGHRVPRRRPKPRRHAALRQQLRLMDEERWFFSDFQRCLVLAELRRW
jgi:hypothetical protein